MLSVKLEIATLPLLMLAMMVRFGRSREAKVAASLQSFKFSSFDPGSDAGVFLDGPRRSHFNHGPEQLLPKIAQSQ